MTSNTSFKYHLAVLLLVKYIGRTDVKWGEIYE